MQVKRAIERLRTGDRVKDEGGTEDFFTVTDIRHHDKGRVDVTFEGVLTNTYHFIDVVTVEVQE